MWKINVYIYIYIYIYVLLLFFSLFSSFSFFFFSFLFFFHVSWFNSLPVTSISVLEVGATCHFWIGLCRFICPGQQPIYSGIPPLPFTFAKISSSDLPRLEPRLEVSASRSRYLLFFLVFRFLFFFFLIFQKCLRFLFLRPTIVRTRL